MPFPADVAPMAWTPDVPFRHGLAHALIGVYVAILGAGLLVAMTLTPLLGAIPVIVWGVAAAVSGMSITKGYRILTYPPLSPGAA